MANPFAAHRLPLVLSRPILTRSAKLVAQLAMGCVATVLVVGCGDPELQKQAAFERQLNEVSDEYASVLGGRPDLLSAHPSDESIAALHAVADKAKGLSGGSAGQLNAARSLASSVYRTAASIELAHAAWLESSEEIVRGMAMSASSIATDLESIASAAEAMDLAGARSTAQSAQGAGSKDARLHQESLRGLEGPISASSAQIAQAASRVSQLEQEAAVLVRQSRELTATAGLGLVEQAAGIKAEARGLAKRSALSQIDVDAASSEATELTTKMRSAQELQAAADSALALLSGFEGDIDTAAAKCREMAKDLRRTASDLMKSIADERSTMLKAAYEAAATDLANASADAEGDVLKNSLLCDELRLKVTQITGLGAQGRMLQSTGGESAAGLSDIKSAAETLLGELKEKATAAADQFSAAGEDPALASIKSYVDGIKKMADETTVEKLLNPPAAVQVTAAKGASGRSMSGVSAGGATEADLDALLARMKAAEGTIDASTAMIDLMDDSTPTGKAMKDMASSAASMMKPLMDAVTEKFGAAEAAKIGKGMAGGAGGGMGGGLAGGVNGLTKKSVSGDTAICTTSDGTEVKFTSRSGSWKVDITGSMTEEQAAQMAQMAPMLSMIMAPMKKAAESVAARVKAGEFANAEEAGAALQQEMMKGLGGGLGGGAGGRRRGGDAGAEGDNE